MTLCLVTLLLSIPVARGKTSPRSHTPTVRFLAEHTNSILAKKCRPTYSSLQGSRPLWLRRHRLAHRAKKGTCLVRPIDIGQKLAALRGWVGREWESLKTLWWHESKWNPFAVNSTSGACGIPQALPCAFSLRDVWGQIRWGIRYISGRYGRPSSALAFWNGNGWY